MIDFRVQTFLSALSKPVLLSILRELQVHHVNAEELDEPKLRISIQEVLTDPEKAGNVYRQLSAYEQEVLEFFIFHVGQDFLSFRQIEQGVKGIQPYSFRLGLVGLRRKGIIYTLRRQWGEEAYVLPIDLEELFYSILLKNEYLTDLLSEDVLSHSEVLPIEKDVPFYQWMFFILDELRRAKDRRIPLTQKGTIHKRYIRVWEEKWMNQQVSLDAFSLSIEHKDTYSNALAVMIDFFTRIHLLRWAEHEVLIDLEMLNRFMSHSRIELRTIFLQYWFHHYKPETDWMNRYYRDAWLMREHNNWLTLLEFVERWESYYTLPAIPSMIQQIKEELLDPLHALGFIQYGNTHEGELVWRWFPVDEGETDIWVQPNLECFCSRLTPIQTLWKLTELFTFDHWDHMLVLRLSEQKVLQAMESGISIPEWLDWLKSISKVPVPTELGQQLKDWENRTHQVTISDVTLLKVNDSQLLQAIIQYCGQHKITIHFTTAPYIAISKEDEDRVHSFFEQNHISITYSSMDQEDNEDVLDISGENGKGFSLISFQQQRVQLKIESVFPDYTEAIPAWNQFPDMWKKQMASYHEKTKRSIIEKAIIYHLEIMVEAHSGRCERIKPVTLQFVEGEWVCLTDGNKKIPLPAMNRMQLLFPVPSET